MKKTYEIELMATTYRTYEVEAESPEQAQDIAFSELDEDHMISTAWKEEAKLSYCEEIKEDSELDKLNQDL